MRAHLLVALALVAGAALLAEVTLVRLLSVALWYPFAYTALATAMLGWGAAAIAVSLSARLRAVPLATVLWVSAAAFMLTTACGYPLWNALPVDPMGIGGSLSELALIPVWLALITLPFACAGLFVARLFAAYPAAGPRLYAADLGGAALGVLVYVMALPALGGPGTLVLAGAMGGLAALVVDWSRLGRRTLLALLVALITAGSVSVEEWVPLRISANKLMGSKAARAHRGHTLWTLGSAVDPLVPRGQDPVLVLDGGTALTTVPRVAEPYAPRPPQGLRGLPYLLGPGRSVLVIGSGGGAEVRTAVDAGATRVLALEIDSAINALVRGKLAVILGGLFSLPQVELRTAEARAYLAAHDERFDAIVAMHTISNAASATGAMSLAESYLLTVEAMQLLLARLSEEGVLVISRPETQMGRLAATLAAAWPFPTDVHDHVALLSEPGAAPAFFSVLVVTRRPLAAPDLAVLRAHASRILYLPGGHGELSDYFAAALAWNLGDAERQVARMTLPYTPARLRPATDDVPFFNLHRPWSSLRPRDFAAVLMAGPAARARLEDLPVAQVALLLVAMELMALAFLFVLPPYRALARRGTRNVAGVAGYFAALGFAFMTLEVVLMQMFTRLVGEPAWSLVATLAVLLAASGAGSLLFAGRLAWSPRAAAAVAAGGALGVAWLAPTLVDLAAPWPFAGRLSLVVAIVWPLGMGLGAPFAAGVRLLRQDDLVAWAWALNALTSVAGSLGALLLASSLGFVGTATVCAGAYLIAARLGGRVQDAQPSPPEPSRH